MKYRSLRHEVTWNRGRREASLKQLKSAASLLKAAAGVNVVAPGAEPVENALLASNASQEIYPGIHVANETHTGALMQLFVIYSQGNRPLKEVTCTILAGVGK